MGQHQTSCFQEHKEQVVIGCQRLRKMLEMRLFQFSMAELVILKLYPLQLQSDQISFKCPPKVFLNRSKTMFGHGCDILETIFVQSPKDHYQIYPDIENESKKKINEVLTFKPELTTNQSELTCFQREVWKELNEWEIYRPNLYKQIMFLHPYYIENFRNQLQVEFKKVVQQCEKFVLLEQGLLQQC